MGSAFDAVAVVEGGGIVEDRGAAVVAFRDDARLAAEARLEGRGPAHLEGMALELARDEAPGE
jgi:hypothetical protein